MEMFALPVFYQPPIHHISFAWIDGKDHLEESNVCAKLLQEKLQAFPFGKQYIQIDQIQVKIGNKVYDVHLK